MRDGVHLFTAVYAPRITARAYPILMARTPYGIAPNGESSYPSYLGPSGALARSGYIFVFQDVRGRYMSEGAFVEMRPQLTGHAGPKDIDESTDTYDTIDWLVKNIPGNNGRVGIYGTSYPGFYAAAGLLCGHPSLKAVLSAGADGRPLPRRRLCPQRRLLPRRQLRFLLVLQRDAPRNQPSDAGALRLRHPRRLRLLSRHGSRLQCRGEILPAPQSLFQRHAPAHLLRRVLALAQPGAAPARHPARSAGRGRMVRRRGSPGAAAAVPQRLHAQSALARLPGHGPLGPWQLARRPM